MKAIIVKDDDFKTVGFEVQTREGKTFYKWGVSQHPTLFKKEVDADVYMMNVAELIKLGKELSDLDQYRLDFFDIAKANNLLKKNQGVNMNLLDDRMQQIKNKINRIISTI